MGRIEAGWHLAKLRLGVVRSDLSLSVLVVLGGIASGAVAVAFYAPAAVACSTAATARCGAGSPSADAGGTGPFTRADLESAVLRKE